MSWRLTEAGDLPIACADLLDAVPFIRHGVTLRGQPEEDFNYSFATADDASRVRANRHRAARSFGYSPDDLIFPALVHSANVEVVTRQHGGMGANGRGTAVPNCDALVTNTPGLLLGITAADCLPIFLVDVQNRAVGLVHSGWRGTAHRIVVAALATMSDAFGTRPENCLVAVGPGIGGEVYEVDAKVYDAFAPEDAAASGVFSPTRPEHWSLDLFAAVRHQLLNYGIPTTQLSLAPYRTNLDTNLFFSHRLAHNCPRFGAFLGMVQ